MINTLRRSYKQKAPKPQKLWCKRFYALAYAPAGKPPKRDGTEYPDLVCGQKPVLSAKPSPLPRVTGAAAPIGKNIHLTVPFLRRGFTPRFSVPARKSPCESCSCMSYSFYVIMNLFAEFVNRFTEKSNNLSKFGHKVLFALDL